MNDHITFRKICLDVLSVDEIDNFVKFHQLLFKNTDITRDWLFWYVSLGTQFHLIHPRIYCAFNGDQIIGSWCVEPKKFISNDGLPITVGRCFAVGIHPEYRRRNLFIRLSEFAIEQEKKFATYDYILGFPQTGRPVIEAHLKSGWEHVQMIEALSLKQSSKSRNVCLWEFKINPSMDEYDIRELSGIEYVGSFYEDQPYKHLRWNKHPHHNYTTIRQLDSGITLKSYSSICHVLDLYGNDKNNVINVIKAASSLAYRHKWQELTIWCAKNEHHREEILSCGFEIGSQFVSSVDLLAVKINAKESLNFDKVHFQMGSEEIYLKHMKQILHIVDSYHYVNSNCFQHQLLHEIKKRPNIITIELKNVLNENFSIGGFEKIISTLKQRTLLKVAPQLKNVIKDIPVMVYDQDPWEAFRDQSPFKGSYRTISDHLNIKSFAVTSKWWSEFINEHGIPSIFVKMWVLPSYCDNQSTYENRVIDIGFIGGLHPYRKKLINEVEKLGIKVDVKPGGLSYIDWLREISKIKIFIRSEDLQMTVNENPTGLNAGHIKDIEIAARGCFSVCNKMSFSETYVENIQTIKLFEKMEEIPSIIDGIKKMDPTKRQNTIDESVRFIQEANVWHETVDNLSL